MINLERNINMNAVSKHIIILLVFLISVTSVTSLGSSNPSQQFVTDYGDSSGVIEGLYVLKTCGERKI